MKALVTGGSGFLGKYLVKELLKKHYDTVVYDIEIPPEFQTIVSGSANLECIKGDILDFETLSEAMRDCDVVFHTAAIADLDKTRSLPRQTMEVNVLGTANCLEAAQNSDVKRFLFASSVYTAGKWGSFYRVSKQAGESLCKTFYSQSMIGAGISNVTDWAAYNDYYLIAPSGNSNTIGNVSGNNAGSTSCATEASKYMSYRGIENWYGHIWKWLDGINTNNNRSYICNVIANLADDTTTNYTDIGTNNINSTGYQATLLNIARGFLPASVGADGVTKITDYYYQTAGWRVAISGGAADAYGALAGGFSLALNAGSAASASHIGGRLCFRK